jgi:hypothetical protein
MTDRRDERLTHPANAQQSRARFERAWQRLGEVADARARTVSPSSWADIRNQREIRSLQLEGLLEEEPPIDSGVAEWLTEELQTLEALALYERVATLANAAYEVYEDALSFVTATWAGPWEFVTAFQGDEIVAFREKYRVPLQRSRPHPDDVAAATNVFCAACELILAVLRREP